MANTQISLRLRPELRTAVQASAEALGLKESDVMRIALVQWVSAQKRHQLLTTPLVGDQKVAQEVHSDA